MAFRSRIRALPITLVAVVAAGGACTTASPAADPSSPPRTAPGASATGAAPSVVAATAGPLLDRVWATALLTDVRTGESFRIAELAASGRTVFVQMMAIWCTTCHAQQGEAVAAFGRLDRDRVAWVAIDVDPSESADALVEYRDRNGFPFTYVVADAALGRALVQDFGEIVLSPPSGNLLVVSPDGRVTQTRHGRKGADELVALAREHGA